MGSNLNYNSSDDTDESEYHSLESDMENDDNLASDALYTEKDVKFNKHFTSEDISNIDNSLDIYDKVSLIYLLYNNPHTALERIVVLLQCSQMNVLNEWFLYEQKQNTKWQEKLLEGLTIIQNYELLKKLGFKKEKMSITYLPLQDMTLHVNLIRKCCYHVCENFNNSKTTTFLQNIENDFNNKSIMYIPKQRKDYKMEFLEMYFLYLETEKYITLNNVKNLAKIFKHMDLENLYDKFQNLHDQSMQETGLACSAKSTEFNIDKTPGYQNSNDISNEKEPSYKVQYNNTERINDVYEINPKCPGILLIINNEVFYTELREQFRHLLPKTDLILESREGTQADKEKLKETFSKFGFEVITFKNRIHEDMLKEIENVVKNFKHSSLFVAILSHGDQGIVYGSNSIGVEVFKIQEIMCQKHLSRIPKVLLLQSCQGSDCQMIDEDYAVDGPRKYNPPKTTNLLTFRASIPGYSAVRHRKDGTWFIQTLCKVIEKNPTDHMQEICRKVIAEVSGFQWGKKCMVPLVETTLTKCLYFKSIR